MAKGTGLIGNFKGKVGNTVGYKLTASNNGQTQGIRVYQPVVKNPKTAAQAEQRAKLLAVNATYRALKMVIDRGNEGLPYGNKSRLAWLKDALKSASMPWFEKGAIVSHAVGGFISKGSLSSLLVQVNVDSLSINAQGVTAETTLNTVGALSTALLAAYPSLKSGDQLTFVTTATAAGVLTASVFSVVLNTTSADAVSGFAAGANTITFTPVNGCNGGAVITSREGSNGEHLRSTSSLVIPDSVLAAAPYNTDSKDAAITSYMSSSAGNSDWAEESLD